MDEKDFVFVNKSLSEREEKEFSEFLKSRKKKVTVKRKASQTVTPKRHLV